MSDELTDDEKRARDDLLRDLELVRFALLANPRLARAALAGPMGIVARSTANRVIETAGRDDGG